MRKSMDMVNDYQEIVNVVRVRPGSKHSQNAIHFVGELYLHINEINDVRNELQQLLWQNFRK